MKKIVWGGFCLIAGILLFWMLGSSAFDIGDPILSFIQPLVTALLATALSVYGLILGFSGLKND